MRPLLSAGALAVLIAAAASPALADAAAPRVLTVTGEGEVKGVPDQARLSTGVVSQAPKAAQALAANARAMNQVMDTLKAAGIAQKDIQTSNFAVSPQYADGNGRPRVTGYEVTNTVNVTVSGLDKLGATIDALVAAGSNQIDGPSFSFADPKPMLAQARAGAVEDATEKAQAYARAAGVTLGPILAINDGGSFSPPEPMPRAMAFKAAAPTPIAAGEASVSANVSITWEIQ
ncbi:MAG: SIMPL domain-containing protein [Alphaproteobacteria bacterium]|nr:SIMPL domain-containing protein [Alphaproteobacteria bacterium]